MSLREPTRDSHIHNTQADIWAAALCRGEDPDMWFPNDSDLFTTFEAKRLCRACPLQLACLEEGRDYEYGIFGGLDPKERRNLRRRDRRSAAAA